MPKEPRPLPASSAGCAETLAALHRAAFAEQGARPWSAGEFAALLAAPGTVLRLSPENCGPERPPIGFALARATAGEAEILSIAVHPSARRRGIGRALLSELHGALRRASVARVFLEVAADNAPALALYEAAGYRRAGLRRAYYRRESAPAADALILARALNRAGPAREGG